MRTALDCDPPPARAPVAPLLRMKKDELIRQVTINCAERGLLLLRVRDEIHMTIAAYQTMYESSIAFGMRKALIAEQRKAEMEAKVPQRLCTRYTRSLQGTFSGGRVDTENVYQGRTHACNNTALTVYQVLQYQKRLPGTHTHTRNTTSIMVHYCTVGRLKKSFYSNLRNIRNQQD